MGGERRKKKEVEKAAIQGCASRFRFTGILGWGGVRLGLASLCH